MNLIFKGARRPQPTVFIYLTELPVDVKEAIASKIKEKFGEKVEYSIPSYVELEVFNVQSEEKKEQKEDTDIL